MQLEQHLQLKQDSINLSSFHLHCKKTFTLKEKNEEEQMMSCWTITRYGLDIPAQIRFQKSLGWTLISFAWRDKQGCISYMKRRCVFNGYSVLQRKPSQLVIQRYTDLTTHMRYDMKQITDRQVTSVKVSDSPKWLLFSFWRVSWSRNTCSTCSSAPAAEEHWSGSTEEILHG